MGVYTIEPLAILAAAVLAVLFMTSPRDGFIVVGLGVAFVLYRFVSRINQRREDRRYRQSIIALAKQERSR